MLKTNRARTISGGVFMSLMLCCTFSVLAVDTPEYWAQINKDGNWRNSNARSVQGNLKARWARAFHGFFMVDGHGGQRSNNVSVRNGQVILIVPSSDPAASYNPLHYSTWGIYGLSNGALVQSTLSPHVNAAGLFVPGGIMDSDMYSGLVNVYWKGSGELFTGQGSDTDHCRYLRFSPYSGEVLFGTPVISYPTYQGAWGGGNSNMSGYFGMSDSNPLIFARGNGGGHDSMLEPASGGLLNNLGSAGAVASMKHYGSFAVEGDWIYPLFVTNEKNIYSDEGYGVQIQGKQYVSAPYSATVKWTYTDPNKAFLSFGHYQCGGAPRAYCLGDDGRLYYYGYNTQGSGSTQVPNFSQGMFLVGVRSADGVSDLNIPVNYNPESESGTPKGWNLAVDLVPQIATLGKYVTVFQPQQSGHCNGHLFCFDTVAKTLAWPRFDFPAGYFKSDTRPVIEYGASIGQTTSSPEQAVQVTIAGDSAYVVDPYEASGALKMRVERFVLSSGTHTTTIVSPVDASSLPIAIPAGSQCALRDVAAVDGTLVCLVDYGTSYIADQVLAVIDGDANPILNYAPVAVISAPITGIPLPHQQHLSDSPAPPTNQFDSGAPIAFSSAGSADPNGGATLAYHWDFGDGVASILANPSHTYASLGSPFTVTNRTATLTVTNAAGITSPPVTRLLAIRDVGSIQTLTFTAVADAYVDAAFPAANYGSAPEMLLNTTTSVVQRGYVRFDLMSTPPSNIVSATLRLFAPPATYGVTNTLQARACANTWSETSIAWNNAPAPGNGVGTKIFADYPPVGFYVDIPVTSYAQTVGADGLLSFALELTVLNNWPLLHLSTKEGMAAPQLILQVNNSAAIAPAIATQPASQTVTAGQTATFSVAATGTAPLSYQWTKNGANISGATGASYTTPATATSDSGATFAVVVSNSAGSATSNNAVLTVNSTTVAPSITTQPANQTVTVGQTATFSVAATGTAPLSYRWTKNGANISGATGASYTTPATATSDNGATFAVVVSNSAGSATSNNAVLTVNSTTVAPSITTQPANQTVTAGQTATFSVAATGTAPLSYQWTKNGANISGATGTAYTTPATATSDSGATFAVVVSNSAGSATSNNATLTVNTTTSPTTVVLQDGLNGYAGTQDTYLDGSGANINNGSKTTMLSSVSNGVLRPLVRFAIFQSEGGSVPNGAAIQSATLSLYRTTIYNDTYTLNRVLKNWKELETTWNKANATTTWTAPGAGGSGTDIAAAADATLTTTGYTAGWVNFNVTTGVAAFSAGTPNYGWRVLGNLLYNLNAYYTREYATDPTLRPKLTVVYQASAPAALAAASIAPQSLTVSNIQGSAKFAVGRHDACSILGVIPNVPVSFNPSGQIATLNIGGAEVIFTLDAKGRGKSAEGSIALKLKSRARAQFVAKIQNGTWAAVWGLNPAAGAINAPLQVAVSIELDGGTYASTVTVSMNAKAGAGATFKTRP